MYDKNEQAILGGGTADDGVAYRLRIEREESGKSSATDIEQMRIFNEAELNADLTVPEPELTEVKTYYRKR